MEVELKNQDVRRRGRDTVNRMGLRGLTLSHHFVQRWNRRVGPQKPTVEWIVGLIQCPTTVVIQRGRMFRLPDGEPYNTLTLYWLTVLGVIISVDPFTNTVVSVLSKNSKN